MNPYAVATAWVAAHHAQIAEGTTVFFLVANLVIKLGLRLNPNLSDWVVIAERSPRVAAAVRMMGALGIQPVAVLQSLIDFVRGRASPGTVASMRAYQVSASRPLIAPRDMAPGKQPDVVVLCRRCGTTWSGPYPMPMRCPCCDDPQRSPPPPPPPANENAKPASQVDTIPPPSRAKS